MLESLVGFLLRLPTWGKKEMRILRDAPVLSLVLVILTAYLTYSYTKTSTRDFYAERLAVMEQRLRLADASSSPAQQPLPRYSFGGTPGGMYVLEFEEADQ